jgi:hypothetical protein
MVYWYKYYNYYQISGYYLQCLGETILFTSSGGSYSFNQDKFRLSYHVLLTLSVTLEVTKCSIFKFSISAFVPCPADAVGYLRSDEMFHISIFNRPLNKTFFPAEPLVPWREQKRRNIRMRKRLLVIYSVVRVMWCQLGSCCFELNTYFPSV